MERVAEVPVTNDASKGLVTSRDPSELAPGELTQAIAGEYRVGSPHFYKMPGRSSTSTALGAAVLAINKLQFDAATDVLAADAGGTVYESAVSLTPSFAASGLTGLSATAVPQYTGFNNRWLRCDGVDDNYIREAGAVPNGTQGNWRPNGMLAAGVPILTSVVTYSTTANTTIKPTSVANQPIANGGSGTVGLVGYHDTQLAYDTSGVGTGQCSGAAGQQVITGTGGTLFTTELAIGSTVTFTNSGEVGVVLSIASASQFTLTNPLNTTLTNSAFTYSGSNAAPDPLTTRSYATTADCGFNATANVASCIWKFSTNIAASNRTLTVRHNGSVAPPDQGPSFGPAGMTWHLEYSTDAGTTWTDFFLTHQPFLSPQDTNFSVPDGVDSSNLWVRSTITCTPHLAVSGSRLAISHAIYDIRLTNGGTNAYTASNAIYYGVSEVYVDSDGVEHQGNMGVIVAPDGSVGPLRVEATTLTNVASVTIALPTKVNPLAVKFLIWRSVDTPGGGYPVMYLIGTVATTVTSWTDTLSIRPDDTAGIGTLEQYKILEILYSTGEKTFSSFYSKAPKSFMSLVFQGCVCYFPSGTDFARRVYYSLPATVSVNAMEQVPEQYFLDFQTPRNDTATSGAITNGGRSMVVFFENYTMLVNYLPQGADPGGFNNVVKEYVSNVRGCSGAHACTEFTLPSGQTLVASVDGLGLWVTNGVNLVEEWSTDIKWDVAFVGVDLTAVILTDKPHKRRIELLFTAANGTRQEYHFFYGRMKQSPEGKMLPLVTGPHPMGVRYKHYTMVSGKWAGFSGDATTVGNIFTEDTKDADDAHGYDSTGIVPWQWHLNDMYVGGINKAHIIESINIKFADSPVKDFAVYFTVTRDSGVATTLTKLLTGDHTRFPKQLYLHAYGDRHSVGFSDLTNSASPEFVRYVLRTRTADGARDR